MAFFKFVVDNGYFSQDFFLWKVVRSVIDLYDHMADMVDCNLFDYINLQIGIYIFDVKTYFAFSLFI